MTVFADMWAYLTDPANWSGSDGIAALLAQQLLLTVTALLMAMAIGLPLALWLGHLGRGGFLAINISNIGRAVPTFALLALLVVAPWPGTDSFGPVRARRAGDPHRAHPLRTAADHHQLVRRDARGRPRTCGRRPAGWG